MSPSDNQATTLAGEQGMALLMTILIIAIVSALGVGMANYGSTDLQISDNYRLGIGAFYAADSGLERSLADLVADNSWTDQLVDNATWALKSTLPDTVTINGMDVVLAKDPVGQVIPGLYPLGTEQSVGSGVFVRQVFMPPEVEARGAGAVVRFLVRSRGRQAGAERAEQVVRAELAIDVGPAGSGGVWDQIVRAGDGRAGEPIGFSDRVHLRGPVQLVGDGTGEVALEGDLTVSNNYGGIDADGYMGADASRLPPLATVLVNGELVETLDTVVNVLDSDLAVENGQIGTANIDGNHVKETIDGIYVEGGDLVGMDGSGDRIHADEIGSTTVPGTVPFPHLDDPYCADPAAFASHREYMENSGLEVDDIDSIDSDVRAFRRADGHGNSISWNPATGVLEIEGIIIFPDDILLGDSSGGGDDPGRIRYRGTGTIYAPRIEVKWDLIPVGQYLEPDTRGRVNSLGLVASERLEVANGDGDRPVKVMAAMFSDDEFRVDGDARIAGAMVGARFTSMRDVQAAHVPTVITYLPPGMPGCGGAAAEIVNVAVANWYHER